ncbi:MAG: tetratricopeptide repeat protein [Bernardetiaceae bacterium]|jgi:tetratricopeptide (TPR) repeat protein|nr:tetratricopeptide repeat protein [Bernardetiaceae bacterium]
MKKSVLAVIWLALCLILVSYISLAQSVDRDLQAGRKAYNEKRYAAAVTSLGRVISRQPDHVAARYLRAKSLMALSAPADAIKDWDRLVSLMPTNGEYYFERGQAHLKRNNRQSAVADFEMASLASPQNATFALEKAKLYTQLGQTIEAAEGYQLAVDLDPNNGAAIEGRRTSLNQLTDEDRLALIETNSRVAAASFGRLEAKPVPDDQKVIRERETISQTKFATIAEGRRYYDQLNARTDFAPSKKRVLLGLVREKILRDVYVDPYLEDVEQMKKLVETESWINPEGRKHYFNTINDSKFWFSGGVQRDDAYVYYRVTKSKFKPRYFVHMYAVRNNESNLVFNSDIAVTEDSLGRRVDLFAAQNRGYMWQVSKTDLLRATSDPKNGNFTYTPEGNMQRFSEATFKNRLGKAEYDKLVIPRGEGLNPAIRSTVHYLITDYARVLSMPLRQ